MDKNRPLHMRNQVDPRIKRAKDENLFLRYARFHFILVDLLRIIDILLIRYSMKYVMHVRNKVHHYGVNNLLDAMNRPDNVGLLTVCNHVTTLDSASIVPSMLPICKFDPM